MFLIEVLKTFLLEPHDLTSSSTSGLAVFNLSPCQVEIDVAASRCRLASSAAQGDCSGQVCWVNLPLRGVNYSEASPRIPPVRIS